jgi:2-polyprenyl-6-methoxyphenol hydroxylase-like FAD-dependent oxidoreductase
LEGLSMSDHEQSQTGCIVVGGGPAGVLLSLLLARKGVEVTLLEMHRDFDRDFRGDTVHMSTLEVLDQIGLAEPLHEIPHAKMHRMEINAGGRTVVVADFTRLRTKYPYIMMMPQSDFLEFLCKRAEQYPSFHRVMGAQVIDLIRDGDQIVGVRYRRDGEEQELRAPLTVASDGRFSRIRALAEVEADEQTPPMDAAWFRVSRRDDEGLEGGAFYAGSGRLLVMLVRPDEWQIAYVFPKGDFQSLREQGIDQFRASIAELVPWLGDRVDEIESFHEVHLLKVGSDRLQTWHQPGLLFIGDAAHVMSPVGGIGINYAIGDAVEAANVLTEPLLRGEVGGDALAEVQRRRERPTRMAQRMQGVMQDNIVLRAIREQDFDLPAPMRFVLATPFLRDIPARIIARGFSRLRLQAP